MSAYPSSRGRQTENLPPVILKGADSISGSGREVFWEGFRCAVSCARMLSGSLALPEVFVQLNRLAAETPPSAEPVGKSPAVTMDHPSLPGFICAVADYDAARRGDGNLYALYRAEGDRRVQVGYWGVSTEGLSFIDD